MPLPLSFCFFSPHILYTRVMSILSEEAFPDVFRRCCNLILLYNLHLVPLPYLARSRDCDEFVEKNGKVGYHLDYHEPTDGNLFPYTFPSNFPFEFIQYTHIIGAAHGASERVMNRRRI